MCVPQLRRGRGSSGPRFKGPLAPCLLHPLHMGTGARGCPSGSGSPLMGEARGEKEEHLDLSRDQLVLLGAAGFPGAAMTSSTDWAA